MTTKTAANGRIDTSSAEERWDAWLDQGIENDRRFQKQAIAAAAVLAIAVAVALFLFR